MTPPIRLYWSSSKPNFGDALSPLICEAVSGKKVVYAKASEADLIAIGSLLQRLKEHWFSHRIHVWGTGLIDNKRSYSSRHHYHAVRGKLTYATVCKDSSPALGDPGLLADILISPSKTQHKKYKIGFIPHYKDKNHPLISELLDRYKHTTIIDIFTPPIEFLHKLAECEIIFSSAMHGLIAADSLGIPNAWIKLSEQVKGKDFKFRDYYSTFGLEATPVQLSAENLDITSELIANQYQRNNIEQIKSRLYNSFPRQF